MIYGGGACASITLCADRRLRRERDVVSLMQDRIHRRSPVAAAAGIVFHIIDLHAGSVPDSRSRPVFSPPFTSSPLLFMSLSPLLSRLSPPLHKHTPPPPPLLASDRPEWCSDLACLAKKKNKKKKKKGRKPQNQSQFDDIIAATHVQPTCFKTTSGTNCCVRL